MSHHHASFTLVCPHKTVWLLHSWCTSIEEDLDETVHKISPVDIVSNRGIILGKRHRC
uniref:Uncharacterized protein n=1 Tax=Anguilla anguilla TaxID=7936 RepID=A0A0E9XM19_ANGAN